MPRIQVQSQSHLFHDILSHLCRRPSSNCIHNLRWQAPLHLRHVSTSTDPAPTPEQDPPKPAPNKVPLRLLLDSNPTNKSAISKIPIPAGPRSQKFTPSVLTRPVGLPYPPRPGQNSPNTTGYVNPYVSRESADARRRVLVRAFARPYFQEWKRLDHFKGKSFVGGERLFRRDKALWFPNMVGWTLLKNDGRQGEMRDTTPMLKGKVSLVGIQSSLWAEEQVKTFIGDKENPELKALVEGSGGLVQKVQVVIQDHWFKALLMKLFRNNFRKEIPEKEWGRFFLVRLARDTGKGLPEDVRDAMGLLNSQVGYVYLVDAQCRIRWAGSGHAWEGESKHLNAGVRRLIEEAKDTRPDPAGEPRFHQEVVREGDLLEAVERALA